MANAEAAATRAGVTIRPATPADAPTMLELEHASGLHHASIDPRRWRPLSLEAMARFQRRLQASHAPDETLLAVAAGVPVGMIELWLKTGRGPDSPRIIGPRVDLGIVVAPAWRGRGVGTALMLAGESWARRHGARGMTLDLSAANDGARRLYERLGYAVHELTMDKPIDGSSVTGLEDQDPDAAPALAGELVRLRPLTEGDRDSLIAVLADPTVVEWWDTRGPEHSADELIAGEPGWLVWAIEADGGFAGSIQATEENDPDYRHAGIDIFMAAPFQGRGIGTDAVRTVARWLFDVRGHHRLTIDPAAANGRAIRTYEKVGFKPVGVTRGYERGVDQTFHDGLLMDMLRGELR